MELLKVEKKRTGKIYHFRKALNFGKLYPRLHIMVICSNFKKGFVRVSVHVDDEPHVHHYWSDRIDWVYKLLDQP